MTCIHLLSVYVTILMVFSFLKMFIHFLGTLCIYHAWPFTNYDDKGSLISIDDLMQKQNQITLTLKLETCT